MSNFKEEVISDYQVIKEKLESDLSNADLCSLQIVEGGDVHLGFVIGGTETLEHWYEVQCGLVYSFQIRKTEYYNLFHNSAFVGECILEKYNTEEELNQAFNKFKFSNGSFTKIDQAFSLKIDGEIQIEVFFKKLKLIARVY